MLKLYAYILPVAFLFLGFFQANATHNRAGEIIIRPVPDSPEADCATTLRVEATIITYTKASSRPADRDTLTICWGDGVCERVARSNGPGNPPQGTLLQNDTKRNFYVATHLYPSRSTYVVSSSGDSAAVAGEAAADLYEVRILARRIEDEPGNTTRFLVIGPEDAPPSGRDKTSMLLSCHNESGGLHKLLTPLAAQGISMTRIESRPSRQGVWDYVFFVDICGHRVDPLVASALNDLKDAANLCKVLGSYPEAVL